MWGNDEEPRRGFYICSSSHSAGCALVWEDRCSSVVVWLNGGQGGVVLSRQAVRLGGDQDGARDREMSEVIKVVNKIGFIGPHDFFIAESRGKPLGGRHTARLGFVSVSTAQAQHF